MIATLSHRALASSLLVGSLALGADPGPAPKDLTFFLNRLVDLDGLPILEEGVRTKQFSSYDRASRYDEATGAYVSWDANGDAGKYLRVEPNGEAVMAEMEGPGCIERIWSANPRGKIRFYFDGAATPSLEYDFNHLFTGKIQPFVAPFVWQRRVVLGGTNPASDSYLPIPYAKSCKVTADGAHDQYYHIGYSTFPKDWNVKTFSLELTAEERAALGAVAKAFSSAGYDPQPAANMTEERGGAVLEPGKATTIAALSGPATIRQFRAKLSTRERWGRRAALLEIFWDGEERPSVQAPIADFFGDAWDEAPYASLPLGIGAMNYCFFRMPFERSARIVVTNGGKETAQLIYSIASAPGAVPAGSGRFHARFGRDREGAEFDYRLLECTGRGKFVGVALFPHTIVGGWWGEGDEKAYVDGEKFPSTFGTGSEDYFGDAWGIRYFVNPFHGCPTRAEAPRQSCYRWHIADAIPFDRSFKITIENYTALREEPGRNDYSSVAYWYQAPGGTDTFEAVTPASCAPQGRVVLGALEAEALLPAGSKGEVATIVTDDAMPVELSGGAALRIAGNPGTAVGLFLPALAAGFYTIEPVTAAGTTPTGAVGLRVDGQPAGDKVSLSPGANPIEAVLQGGQPESAVEVMIDYFLLHPYRNFVRRWYLAGPFDNIEGAGFERPYEPEAVKFDLAAAFKGVAGDVGWKRIEAPSGLVTSEGGFFKRNDDIVVYAYCEIEAPDALKAVALAGSDDGIKVWINAKLVHAKPARRALVPDQDRFDVELVKGRNAILLKIDQGGGPWGFTFRIEDPEERLRVVVPK